MAWLVRCDVGPAMSRSLSHKRIGTILMGAACSTTNEQCCACATATPFGPRTSTSPPALLATMGGHTQPRCNSQLGARAWIENGGPKVLHSADAFFSPRAARQAKPVLTVRPAPCWHTYGPPATHTHAARTRARHQMHQGQAAAINNHRDLDPPPRPPNVEVIHLGWIWGGSGRIWGRLGVAKHLSP